MGHVELTEAKMLPGRDFSEDINRTVEQMTHPYREIQLAALSWEDVTGKQATLQRAQSELARLHALTPVEARLEPVRTGQTFRQRWESLDAAGWNEFLRANNVRAVASRDELPPIEHQAGPLTATHLPRTAIIDRPDLYAVIYLGSLGDIACRASSMTATVRPS